MHLLIDLQACQTPGSRLRGIGRYSLALARAMAEQAQRRGHRVSLLLSDRFANSLAELRQQFEPLVGAPNIHILALPGPSFSPRPHLDPTTQVDELLRQCLIAQIAPDVVHIASLFEGPEAAAGIASLASVPLTVVTLYDLIPLQYPDLYLADPGARQWYNRRLHSLQNADLLLAISNNSRLEVLELLGLPSSQVVNISSAIDRRFHVAPPSAAREAELRQRYGVRGGFVMYTGGVDHRKNLEALIEAYASLPDVLRQQHQLVVVCSMQAATKAQLTQVAWQFGLATEDVVLTGYVPDDDLVALYNLATVFVFPSLHEGFGLPVLEAMACGTPTLGASTSSIPEVLDLEEALFDPSDTGDMTQAIAKVLTDADWRQRLRIHGLQRAQCFSWARCAQEAWAAIETARAAQLSARCMPSGQVGAPKRLRLAYVSPWPPETSGIADYSARLVVALARHYDIELVSNRPLSELHPLRASFTVRDTEWFRAHAAHYDRVLYHMGNSSFHAHMLALMAEAPGVLVLHDCFLSGLMDYVQQTSQIPRAFDWALWHGHGPPALLHQHQQGVESTIAHFTANYTALQHALGVVTHSHWSVQRLLDDHGPHWQTLCRVVSFACQPKTYAKGRDHARLTARQALGLSANAFVVCSFGMLANTKCNLQLLAAWQQSGLASDPDARLVWVGSVPDNDNGRHMQRQQSLFSNIHFTQHVNAATYALWLDAADLAVQLRIHSRGETSAAMFDCLAHQLPLVYNAHGPAAELPPSVGVRLPDVDADALGPLLVEALRTLRQDPSKCRSLAESGYQWVRYNHHVGRSADQYHEGIEALYAQGHAVDKCQALPALAQCLQASRPWPMPSLAMLADCLVRNQRGQRGGRLLLNISTLSDAQTQSWLVQYLPHWVTRWPSGLRFECVAPVLEGWSTRRQTVAQALNMPMPLPDESVMVVHEDIWVDLIPGDTPTTASPGLSACQHAHRHLTHTLRAPDCLVTPDLAHALLRQWLSGSTTNIPAA